MLFAINQVLHRYGDRLVRMREGTGIEFRGFLQPPGSRGRQNMEYDYCPLGEVPRGQYILLAPIESELAVGDKLVRGSLNVIIRRLETVTALDSPVYFWGLCEETEGDDRWGEPL